MKYLRAPMEVKTLGDAGEFEGYASVSGNVDEGGDRIEVGGFKEFELTSDGMVRICDAHSTRVTIGKAAVAQDSKGLQFKGNLILDLAAAREAYIRMKHGLTDAMSVGYDVLDGGMQMAAGGVRVLSRLKLWEISPVTFGMNREARITSVKGLHDLTTVREFEDFLRDVGGFSNVEAKAIASNGYKAISARRDDGVETSLAEIANAFTKFSVN